jgi:hypothetical protein
LYSVAGTGTPTKTVSSHIAFNTAGIVDSPIVDVSGAASDVYVSVGCSTTCGGGSTGAVVQFPANTFAGGAGVVAGLGSDAAATVIYDGAFDNTHEVGGGTTGFMYVCGYHTTGTVPEIFQIPMNSFTGAATVVGTPTSAAGTCGPMIEFLSAKTPTTLSAALGGAAPNTSATVTSAASLAVGDYIEIDSEALLISAIAGDTLTVARGQLGTTRAAHLIDAVVTDDPDWMFLSVTATGNDTGCTGACLYNYNMGNSSHNLAAGPTLVATTGIIATGGTTGIIIDNASTTTGEEQIYYSTLGVAVAACTGNGTSGNVTGHCAVQTSQAAP